MSTQRALYCHIDASHLENWNNAYNSVTTTPFKSALFQFIPYFATPRHNSVELKRGDSLGEGIFPSRLKEPILDEIEQLARCAFLNRSPSVHAILGHHFFHYGDGFSLTKPTIIIPHQILFRLGRSSFTQEKPEERLSSDLWNFSDDETRFLIAREIAQIKDHRPLFLLILKIALFAVLYLLYSNPFSMPIGMALGSFFIMSYFACERKCQQLSDRKAIEILTRRIENPTQARNAALSALEKLRLQECARRERNALCKVYISRNGDHYLDPIHPLISFRIRCIMDTVHQGCS